ncbi:MAG: hypothetical protein OSJ72_15520, partial [Lachnospiraceae bacterium]|nr:hypothetical protein [Lachnospiraceae bacterium]
VVQDMIYPAPATLQLYKKPLIFTIKFTLNFFLPPLSFVLLPVLLSALVLKLPLKVLFVVADNLGIR